MSEYLGKFTVPKFPSNKQFFLNQFIVLYAWINFQWKTPSHQFSLCQHYNALLSVVPGGDPATPAPSASPRLPGTPAPGTGSPRTQRMVGYHSQASLWTGGGLLDEILRSGIVYKLVRRQVKSNIDYAIQIFWYPDPQKLGWYFRLKKTTYMKCILHIVSERQWLQS